MYVAINKVTLSNNNPVKHDAQSDRQLSII